MEPITERPVRFTERPSLTEEERTSSDPEGASWLWSTLGLLWADRRLIAGIVGVVLVAAVALALLIPKDYAGEARVLKAEGGVASMLGLVERAAGGGLGRLLTGGGRGDYARYLAILNSRSLLDRAVEEFDLVTVYGLDGRREAPVRARQRLLKNLHFEVDLEYDYLGVTAYDRDPARAAAIANYFVAELNRVNAELSSDNARQTRVFVEQRLREAEADLDSARAALQSFQERYGVVELGAQAEAYMGSVAQAQGRVAELEVRYQTLLSMYGPDNPQVASARAALRAARSGVDGILRGREAVLPVETRQLPAMGREFAELMQVQLIQAQIVETIYPFYEQVRFQERAESHAVQVLDTAVVPTRPARPSRRMIVILLGITGLLVACLFVLTRAWWYKHHRRVAYAFEAGHRRVRPPGLP